MRLEALELVSFRFWESLRVAFPRERTALVGPNGCGKTSILEAAWYVASLSSHRSSSDSALLRRGAASAVVRADISQAGRRERVEVEIVARGRARARRGGASVPRRRDVLGALRAQVFSPERVEIVRGDPAARRRFADELLVQLHPRYHAVSRDYERALRQRTALLRDAAGASRPPAGLEAWDEALVSAGSELLAGRADVARRLAPRAAEAWAAAGGQGELAVAYEPNVPVPAGRAGAAEWAEAMRRRLGERRGDELARGASLVGPHRDEVAITMDGMVARTHSSFGEGWLIAVALVLGAAAAIAEAFADEPVLLLDDPFTPLDPARRERLAGALPAGAQAIVTAADPGEIPETFGGGTLLVREGEVLGA
ncbi:MAG: DNA replication and repair protein RecF [Acidobacteria bacterium]|nr:DNA replication and repair protein RecF [Acidobacteriota bacterium]